ncbi:MAG: AAA domain-containing protein, partial [Planctomycetota bacterium]
GPACLELHSNKANKKGVLAQFKEALDDGRVRGSRRRKWEEIGADVDTQRTRLNAHVDALHRPRASGESIHEVVARLGELPSAGDSAGSSGGAPVVDLGLDDPRSVDESTLRTWRQVLDEIDVVAAEQLVGPEHPLLLVGRTEYSPIVETETRDALRAHDAPASELLAAARDVLGGLGFADDAGGAIDGIRAPESDDAWERLGELAASLVEPPDLGSSAAAALAGGAVVDDAAAAVATAKELGALRASFEASFRTSPTTLDLGGLESARRDMAAGGLLGIFKRWGGERRLVDAFRGIALDPSGVRAEVAIRGLDDAQRAVQLDGDVAAVSEDVRALLGDLWRGADTDATAAGALVERARAIAKRVEAYAAATGSERKALAAALAATIERSAADLAASGGALARRFRALEDARRGYAEARAAVVDAACPLEGAPLGASLDEVVALQALCLRWVDRWADLRGWSRWQALRERGMDAGLGSVIASIEAGELAPGATRAGFDATFAAEWALHEISADPALKAFDGPDHARAVGRFVELDEERLQAAREETRQRLGAKRPQPATLREKNKGTALGTLQREITKKTRHMAIRRLLAELGELAMDLKPCFLMSPMSVAQYLEPDHERFDLVVFDEASQIPVWDAIGAIARGKQAVVVGDPKQLPPTSFFDRGDDESIEEDEVEDLESILEECIGAQVPIQRLSWHYRSRHESLIAFSNARYYDGQLLTFPSNASDRLGVSSRFVEGGVYDKGKTRTNQVEARAVADEVVRRLRDPDERGRSIGVVTFSQAQQTLLLDLFDEAMREHPEIESAFDESQDEPVFVKNLENVQGDERDVILFSIGYGPDANGKISMNFGPLNRDGGERRLNVAITRAREEVVVFSSIRWDQIDLSRTSARAVGDLRAFLRHAEGRVAVDDAAGTAERADGESHTSEDGFVRALASRLEARGWVVTTEVGASSVRVDLAVRHPERAGRFLMGIETDGRNYARSATARDRDRLRGLVLDGLGWSFERAWAIDWWRNPDAEVDRLDAALRAALEADRPE